MGSKKHKKESKKKKHRSRSRSPLDGEERERKRHRKHKDRKKDRSPDVEEVPVDSHLDQLPEQVSNSRSRSRSSSVGRGSSARRERHRHHSREDAGASTSTRDVSRERDEPAGAGGAHASGGGGAESLSIQDTNRLRAKLGLKPLEVHEKPQEDGKFKDDLGEFYHKPAANLSEKRRSDKLRERLEERRERRQLEQKLQTKLLTEVSDDEDASAWVNKSRDIEKQKKEAAKRAAMLDEMDAVFGVSALVEEDERIERADAYSTAALSGLRVAHDLDSLAEERDTVLTLADKEVLAEDCEDVLVNVNIVDEERYKKNIESRKKAKAGYQAYDEEAELEASLGFSKPVLAKYDEEIDQQAAERRRGFVLGDRAGLEAQRFRDMMRQERLRGGPDKRLESLRLPELKLASDYLSEAELNAKFKKSKRLGKIRKKAKHEPIDVDDYDAGVAPLETDDTDVQVDQLALVVDEDEVEPDSELQTALARARRLRQAEPQAYIVPKVEDILEGVKEEPHAEGGAGDGSMVLDACAEFCRTLGDIPTYGLAGNRDQAQEIMDFEREELEAEPSASVNSGAWLSVDVGSEGAAEPGAGAGALVAEPALGAGVAGALQLALSKGYLERAGPAPAPRAAIAHLLAARHYSIEDKTLGDDDNKHGRRERGGGGGGPLQDFREKTSFRPRIKLEYADDDGRPLRPKEAFRYLSHKFHGKGPGKNKQEKRIKKQLQEGLMKKMSSTDTPLGTLQMLQEKQKETRSPYVLLSGAKRDPPR